jgi:hypothetical protein
MRQRRAARAAPASRGPEGTARLPRRPSTFVPMSTVRCIALRALYTTVRGWCAVESVPTAPLSPVGKLTSDPPPPIPRTKSVCCLSLCRPGLGERGAAAEGTSQGRGEDWRRRDAIIEERQQTQHTHEVVATCCFHAHHAPCCQRCSLRVIVGPHRQGRRDLHCPTQDGARVRVSSTTCAPAAFLCPCPLLSVPASPPLSVSLCLCLFPLALAAPVPVSVWAPRGLPLSPVGFRGIDWTGLGRGTERKRSVMRTGTGTG